MSTIAPMSDRHSVTAYPLRLSPELKAQVEAAAKSNNRSFNSEVTSRLQSSFESLSRHEQSDLQMQAVLEVAKLSMALFEMMKDANQSAFPETVVHNVDRIHHMLEAITGKKDD